MKKRHQQYYTIVGAIILILLLFWLFRSKPAAAPSGTSDATKESQNQAAQPTGAAQTDVWLGKLMASDSPSKGNLMLVTKDRTIYIKTSRDFSSLVGKNVRVSYEGSYQSFALGDITLDEQQ